MIRNSKLGGTDWTYGETPLKSEDLNDTFDAVVDDISSTAKMIGQNGLNILDLTAQMNLTAGINANFIRDIYTDANGYLNTINITNTTATHSNGEYKLKGFLVTSETEYTHCDIYSTTSTTLEINGIANDDIILSQLTYYITSNTNITVDIFVGLEKIYTKGPVSISPFGSNPIYWTFEKELYDRPIIKNEHFKLKITSTNNALRIASTFSGFTGSMFSINVGSFLGKSDGTNLSSIQAKRVDTDMADIIETNILSLEIEPSKFMIISNAEEIVDNSEVVYNVSFDNGLNYQTALKNIEYNVQNKGTDLILKQTFTPEDILSEVIVKNYGVLIW